MFIFRRIHCIHAAYGTVTLYESDSTICCMYTMYNPEDEHLRLELNTGIIIIIIIIIIIFLHGLGRLTGSGIDALPSFPGASTISSPPRFVVEGVFRKSGVAHSFEMVDPVLFVFGFHVLYSRDL